MAPAAPAVSVLAARTTRLVVGRQLDLKRRKP
jgi:hypothetical protein